MSAITKKHFLLENYEDYTNIFLKKKTIKLFKLKDVKHLINLISGKNSFYGPIYNLSAWELEVLQEYLNSALDKK